MASSRWGSLIVRAATQGLLDVEEGCPLTRRYLIKEAWVLNELARQDMVQLGLAKVGFHSNSAQVVNPAPNFGLFDAERDEALSVFMRVGKLLSPWDDSWNARLKEIETRQYDRQNQIGETGLTDRGIVDLIRKYEVAKAEWLAKQKASDANESAGHSGP